MLHAFGGGPSLLVFVFAYFVGQAGNTVPIPGAVSGGIVGVLAGVRRRRRLALVSVLGYRSVAIWLPAPIGLVALTSLKRTLAGWAGRRGVAGAHRRRARPRAAAHGAARAADRRLSVSHARRRRDDGRVAAQDYLDQARQLQALSLTVHIPLVCFGIAFPSMVLFAESRFLRTGDEVYRTIARRWSKVMLTLFAVGVVTGTILSFEFGMLWPDFVASFGNVFGLGFALEGFSFFLEAIFIGIYVYGWDRLSPRMHFLSGIPVAIAGVMGSTFVIAVNAWMNHPGGFRIVNGRAVDVHPWSALFGNSFLWHELVHMYLAAYMVAGFLIAGWYAWCFLKGRFGRYERAALAIPLAAAALVAPVQILVGDWAARVVTEKQPVKLAAMEGLQHTTKGAPEHLLGWYQDGEVKWGIKVPKLLSLLAKHDPNATIAGLDTVPPRDRPPINIVRYAFQTMVGIGTLLATLAVFYLVRAHSPQTAATVGLVLPRRRRGRAAGAGRAGGRMGHDRGRPSAVDRLRGDAHVGGRHERRRGPGRLRDARAGLPRAGRRGRVGAVRLARMSSHPARRRGGGACSMSCR